MPGPQPKSQRILFVCLGNICRSPLAEAVFRHKSSSSSHTFPCIDSAGTGAYHANSQPDPRTLSTLRRHGIKGYTHSARKVRLSDFDDFDWVFAMDAENFEDLVELQTKAARKGGAGEKRGVARVVLFGAFGGNGKQKGKLCDRWEEGRGEEVVDPYYGGGEGFEIAHEQAVRFTDGFLAYLDKHEAAGA